MTRPKHRRPRWRYLAVAIEAWPDATIDRRSFQAAVWTAIRSLFGDAGSAAIDGTVVRFQFDDGRGEAVVRAHRGETDRCRAALACLPIGAGAAEDGAVPTGELGCYVRGTSGTIRACEEKYLGRDRKELATTTVAFGGDERPAFVRGDAVDVRLNDDFVGAAVIDTQ